MVCIEQRRSWERAPSTLTLCNSNWRPERHYVELARVRTDDDGDLYDHARCVGFVDDPDLAEQLFDSVQRALQLVILGDCVDLDWAEIPPGVELF